jgi:hypothetical protein
VGRTWHAWERRGKCTAFWWESQEERNHLKDKDIDGRMGSEWILRRLAAWCSQLAQDRGRWRALVNTVTNLRVPAPQSYFLSLLVRFIKMDSSGSG